MFEMSFPSLQQNNTFNKKTKSRILSHFLNLPPLTLQSNTFNIRRKLTSGVIVQDLPSPDPTSKGSTYEERSHVVIFSTQVYQYEVLTPSKGLHAWAA